MIGIGKNLFKSNVKVGGGASYDADAQAYFTANTAITSNADKTAINDFYLGLKTDGIYTKIKAMYLPIWGSASSSKWNLVNPLDTNAGFRLTFATGFTYSNSGITGNGTSSYANTFFNSSVNMISTTGHLGFYSRTQTASSSQTDIGCINSSVSPNQTCFITTTGASANTRFGSGLISATKTISDYRGLFLSSRLNSTSLKLYIKGILEVTNTTSNGTVTPNLNIFLGASNNQQVGGPATYSTKQCCFYTMGSPLTDTEATNYNSRVQTLMTYFGINV
jgi:hypothetical protein